MPPSSPLITKILDTMVHH